MSKKIVTIHQPDFMPWLGFFTKIAKADVWVVMDHVENNPKDAAFWGRRVQILVNQQAFWLSVTLKKESGRTALPINEIQIADVKSKMLKTTLQSYSKAPFFQDYKYLLEDYFNSTDSSLINRNMAFIKEVIGRLGISTELVYSSDLECKEKSTDLLIEIVKKVDGTHYLSGDGASGYQTDEMFEQNNIALEYNNFQHPKYSQFNNKSEFVKGLSIIDGLMNIGEDELKKLLP